MNRPEENDPLDALLREQNRYIEDNGFTARVVSALPRRRSWFWSRQTFLLGVTLLGWMLAMWWLPWENLPPLSLSALLSPNSAVLLPWMLVLSVMGSLIWAVIAAVQWED
jgi:hypothetical protein